MKEVAFVGEYSAKLFDLVSVDLLPVTVDGEALCCIDLTYEVGGRSAEFILEPERPMMGPDEFKAYVESLATEKRRDIFRFVASVMR